jgi:hypothetical protein
MQMAQIALSTGVLLRDPVSFNAHVDIGNFSSNKQMVEVEIWDWGVDQEWDTPTPIPVSPSGAIIVNPNTLRSFLAVITHSAAQPSQNLSHYEVRVKVSEVKNVVVNCFAIKAGGEIVLGNTVLHKNLVEIAV